jgi:phosphinothricin acetyltransferase
MSSRWRGVENVPARWRLKSPDLGGNRMTISAIRPATSDDAGAIAAIYAPYVLSSTVTFEEIAPDISEMRARMQKIWSTGLPYHVAELDGVVVGYAYVGLFHPRIGYRFAVENSVYVAQDKHRRGIGSALLRRLIQDCTDLGYRHMVALIGENEASVAMHARLGFRDAGSLPGIGLKFGRWIGIIQMQLALGEGSGTIPMTDPRRMPAP